MEESLYQHTLDFAGARNKYLFIEVVRSEWGEGGVCVGGGGGIFLL